MIQVQRVCCERMLPMNGGIFMLLNVLIALLTAAFIGGLYLVWKYPEDRYWYVMLPASVAGGLLVGLLGIPVLGVIIVLVLYLLMIWLGERRKALEEQKRQEEERKRAARKRRPRRPRRPDGELPGNPDSVL